MTVDYEALGRYHAIFEQYQDLAVKRHNLAISIDRMTLNARLSGGTTDVLQVLDHVKLDKLTKDLVTINQELMHAVEQANHYADIIGKPKIKIMKD